MESYTGEKTRLLFETFPELSTAANSSTSLRTLHILLRDSLRSVLGSGLVLADISVNTSDPDLKGPRYDAWKASYEDGFYKDLGDVAGLTCSDTWIGLFHRLVGLSSGDDQINGVQLFTSLLTRGDAYQSLLAKEMLCSGPKLREVDWLRDGGQLLQVMGALVGAYLFYSPFLDISRPSFDEGYRHLSAGDRVNHIKGSSPAFKLGKVFMDLCFNWRRLDTILRNDASIMPELSGVIFTVFQLLFVALEEWYQERRVVGLQVLSIIKAVDGNIALGQPQDYQQAKADIFKIIVGYTVSPEMHYMEHMQRIYFLSAAAQFVQSCRAPSVNERIFRHLNGMSTIIGNLDGYLVSLSVRGFDDSRTVDIHYVRMSMIAAHKSATRTRRDSKYIK
ncbi:hypothetical protein BJ508DRAFT_303332 [Ascobolus immersus RN42]|uniref:Uncharacterized protein n=1 Tax=Ascobolus immersus RN42 TaxID=1160509 RepID=A0A3N4IL80_ASCIM|nr:hypothetical protein BJ508DRAFT_303332 [Ascobolus immersus RN42]